MKKICLLCILLSAAGGCFAQYAMRLRCEYLVNPLGIDVSAPRLSWVMDDARHGARQTAYRLVVGKDSAAVAGGNGECWDTEKVMSDEMRAVYAGDPLESFTRYYWSVRLWDGDGTESVPVTAFFETGMMNAGEWKGTWISDGYSTVSGNGMDVKPAPYFRKEFTARGNVKSARVYLAVAGLYELYVNGKPVGNQRLDPAFTLFDRRNLYVVHDVTEQLREGRNAVGVLLGNGWYNHQSITHFAFHRVQWRNRPVFCMDLRITFDDGSEEIIVTDGSWKTSLSPVTFNCIFTGEQYDARLEQPGWNTAGFDDSAWKSALVRTAPAPLIVAQQMHPIRNVEKIPVRSFKMMDDRTYLYDLGRNIAGVTELRVQGEAGTQIRLVHSETLDANGEPDLTDLAKFHHPADDSDPFQTDIYTLGGNGVEVFMPRFNYKGFQYVKVTADRPVALTRESLTGWFMHSDVPPTGHIETANPLIDHIWQAARSSYRSNLYGYLTDCPHREKNGWTADGHIAAENGLYNFDGITVYEKWLADHRDEQQPNGMLSSKIPGSGDEYTWANGVDWTSSIAIIPWNIYLFYGDSRLLEQSYEHIKRLVDRVAFLYPDGLTDWGLGDWIPAKSQASVELTTSIYYYADAVILTRAARMFGRKRDAEKYDALAVKIRTAINNKYLDRETGIYRNGFQTGASMALYWGVVPDDMRTKTAAALAQMVRDNGDHLDVGLLGSKSLLNALSENGYGSLAYAVAAQETAPSWGYWIANGATTLFEDWANADVHDHAGSHNHPSFGEVGAWFFKALGGIRPDPEHPGFANILLKPHFVAGLNFAKVTYDSPRGTIVCNWERKKKDVICRFIIPANATATFTAPDGYRVKKAASNGAEELRPAAVYRLPAGSYLFTLTPSGN
jgi:alpha-L-rhamnosidase